MALTQTQITLVQQSFAQVAPIADDAAALFYERLFTLNPSLRALFKHDMTEQGKKLMQMLAVAVHALDHLEEIVPAVQAMGKRHVDYGVKAEDYETVGAALLWALEQGLGAGFTPEVKTAWAEVYAILSATATSDAYAPELA